MAGRLHVDDVLQELSANEISEWQAYYMLEPWGDDWRRSATIAAVLAEINRNAEERDEPFTVQDFMPGFAETDDEEEPEQKQDNWMAWKAIFEGMKEASQ